MQGSIRISCKITTSNVMYLTPFLYVYVVLLCFFYFCSHYKVVVVIGDLSDDTNDIPDGNLFHMDNRLNYYVAIVGTVTNNSLTLGNRMLTSLDSVEYYYNQPLKYNQKYSYFIRIYSQCVCFTRYYMYNKVCVVFVG